MFSSHRSLHALTALTLLGCSTPSQHTSFDRCVCQYSPAHELPVAVYATQNHSGRGIFCSTYTTATKVIFEQPGTYTIALYQDLGPQLNNQNRLVFSEKITAPQAHSAYEIGNSTCGYIAEQMSVLTITDEAGKKMMLRY